MLPIRTVGCLPGSDAPEGSTAEFLRLTKKRGVKLFRSGYKLAHVRKEAEIMAKAAKLGLGPKVYGLVQVWDGKVVRYGIEVAVVHVVGYATCLCPDRLSSLRKRIRKSLGLLAVDVRPDNVGITDRGVLVCIDWSLARLVPIALASKSMKRRYTKRTLNDDPDVPRCSLAPNDPYIGAVAYE